MIPQKDIAQINEIGIFLKCTTKLRFIGTRIEVMEVIKKGHPILYILQYRETCVLYKVD